MSLVLAVLGLEVRRIVFQSTSSDQCSLLCVFIYFCFFAAHAPRHQRSVNLAANVYSIKCTVGTVCTVLLRNNLTENAFGTRPERVRQCVPFAFLSRSICVPFAFRSRSVRVPFAFQSVPICVPLLLERIPKRVPVTLAIRSGIIGNYRDFPCNDLASLHNTVFYYTDSYSYGEAFGVCEKKNNFFALQ